MGFDVGTWTHRDVLNLLCLQEPFKVVQIFKSNVDSKEIHRILQNVESNPGLSNNARVKQIQAFEVTPRCRKGLKSVIFRYVNVLAHGKRDDVIKDQVAFAYAKTFHVTWEPDGPQGAIGDCQVSAKYNWPLENPVLQRKRFASKSLDFLFRGCCEGLTHVRLQVFQRRGVQVNARGHPNARSKHGAVVVELKRHIVYMLQTQKHEGFSRTNEANAFEF